MGQGRRPGPRGDFRGIHGEVGANPELPTLDAALTARVDALAPAHGDPFAVEPEPVPSLLAA